MVFLWVKLSDTPVGSERLYMEYVYLLVSVLKSGDHSGIISAPGEARHAATANRFPEVHKWRHPDRVAIKHRR